MSIARANGLELKEAAHAAAMATAFIVKECAKDIGAETSFNIAAYGFIEGCKTVPPLVGYPDATAAAAIGINDRTWIVGGYLDTHDVPHGFLLKKGTFSSIDFPGAEGTRAFGINARGHIVGGWSPDPGCPECFVNAFLLTPRGFINLAFPNALETVAWGINAKGQIVGHIFGEDEAFHGFLRDPGTALPGSDFENASGTLAWNDGINVVKRDFVSQLEREGKNTADATVLLDDLQRAKESHLGHRYQLLAELWALKGRGPQARTDAPSDDTVTLYELAMNEVTVASSKLAEALLARSLNGSEIRTVERECSDARSVYEKMTVPLLRMRLDATQRASLLEALGVLRSRLAECEDPRQ